MLPLWKWFYFPLGLQSGAPQSANSGASPKSRCSPQSQARSLRHQDTREVQIPKTWVLRGTGLGRLRSGWGKMWRGKSAALPTPAGGSCQALRLLVAVPKSPPADPTSPSWETEAHACLLPPGSRAQPRWRRHLLMQARE